MNAPKYPELAQHQHLISCTGFLETPLANSETRISYLALQPTEWHNVTLLNPNRNPKLLVRFFANLQQITVAQLPAKEYINAWRIADMTTLFFRKYRERGLTDAVLPSKLNISLEQAVRDLNLEKVHVGLLEDYEKILVRLNVLPTSEQLTAKKSAAAAAVAAKSVDSGIRPTLLRIEQRLTTIENFLNTKL